MTKSNQESSATRRIVAVGVCAALYTVIGLATFLGIFTPVLGVVRFWPAVFVPATFAMLFGPSVGGMGAAIGIFLSDLYVFYTTGQTNPLLSLIAGVPANFLGFYILGRIGRSKVKWNGWKFSIPLVSLGIAALGPLAYVEYMVSMGMVNTDARWISTILFFLAIIIFILGSVGAKLRRNYLNYYVGGTLGLLIGGLWIGFGIWLYSQLFGLPITGERIDLALAVYFFLWVFGTEIPFILLVPPILDVVYKAFPFLKTIGGR
ncbi:MAG: ECF transporter S component [Thermoproteota archaeon]|nr:ECF transporter S component [Candidatus Brockarchaeota archaeon]